MYKYKKIARFMEKINIEAEREAQKVFNKYQKEVENMIQSQLPKGHKIYFAMGSCVIEDKNKKNLYNEKTENFTCFLNGEYVKQQRAGFTFYDLESSN